MLEADDESFFFSSSSEDDDDEELELLEDEDESFFCSSSEDDDEDDELELLEDVSFFSDSDDDELELLELLSLDELSFFAGVFFSEELELLELLLLLLLLEEEEELLESFFFFSSASFFPLSELLELELDELDDLAAAAAPLETFCAFFLAVPSPSSFSSLFLFLSTKCLHTSISDSFSLSKTRVSPHSSSAVFTFFSCCSAFSAVSVRENKPGKDFRYSCINGSTSASVGSPASSSSFFFFFATVLAGVVVVIGVIGGGFFPDEDRVVTMVSASLSLSVSLAC